MKSRIEILNTLPYFTGTVEYHKHKFLNYNLTLTDGAVYIREACDSYWLFDIIAQQAQIHKKFIAALKQSKDGQWKFIVCDFNKKNVYYRQQIIYSDFPLDGIRLYFLKGICYLPGEH